MAEIKVEPEMNRRGFLKTITATAAAAVAVGAGAGVLKNRQLNPAIISSGPPVAYSPVSIPTAVPPVVNAAGDTDLLARLAAVQAENMRLRAELEAAQRSLNSVQQASSSNGDELELMRMQLNDAHGEIGILSGLVALYDQLEGIDLENALNGGLAAMGTAVDNLMDRIPTVNEGLALGQEALSQLEAHIPLLENGRQWLGNHIERVSNYYQAVETTLQVAVETVGSFLQLLNKWFQDIAKWLPFGMGKTAAQVMDSLTQLLSETPNTISGLRTNVAQPLDVWLGQAGSMGSQEAPLRRDIIKPLREQALAAVANTLEQAEAVQTAYQAQLAEPVREAANRRQLIQTMINDYREKHQV